MKTASLRISLLICVALTLVGCESQAPSQSDSLEGRLGVQAGPLEVSVSINTSGEISVTAGLSRQLAELSVGLGPVRLSAGIEATKQLTRERKYYLFIVWQDEAGQVWRDEYRIGTKFRVTFSDREHVREISGDNDNIIVVVERTLEPMAVAATLPPPVLQPSTQPVEVATAIIRQPTQIVSPQVATARASDTINLRGGPGTEYPVIGGARPGESFRITGRNSAGSWWQACCLNGSSVWLSASYVEVSGATNDVPVINVAPPPATQPPAQASCTNKPGPSFARLWNRERIGCPTRSETGITTAYEGFQRGWMLWRQDDNGHYAFLNSGTYTANFYPQAEPPNFACSEAEAKGIPRRGFSRVWCENQNLRSQIGDATGDEIGDYRPLQEFENGFMIYVKERGTVVTVFRTGTWNEQR